MSDSVKQTLIYDAGKKLFGKFGVKRVSVDMIVGEAGVGKGTFYLYFQNKDELYENIVNDILAASSEHMKQKAIKIPDVKERLVYKFVGAIVFFEKNDIIRNLAQGSHDYFTSKIDHLFVKQSHLSLLKDLLSESYDGDADNLHLLGRLISAYTHISHMKGCFPSEEEYIAFAIDFASVVVYGFFSDFRILSKKVKYDTIVSEIETFMN